MRKLIFIIVMLCFTGVFCARAQRYDRGFDLKSNSFVEKGTWMVGGSVAYSTHNNDNYRFLVIENINSTGYRFSVSPLFCYMIRDNMGIGMRFAYGRNLLKVDSASVSIDEIDINVKDYYSLSHDFTAMAVYRNYIPLGNSRRFAMFSEMQLSYGLGQAKLIDNHGTNLIGSFEESYTVSLGLNPGMMAFINDHLAVEVNVGMLGLKYSHVDQTHNQVDKGNRDLTSINFKVNILSIGFGLSYYL
ncbi:MAG: outer membrane beta-barrel protein [Alistipes sp.]|nr:outer membrane beta-barrel protein [Alistipes sp.]MBQ7787537.1 outer membrane beta-barrel protein [Alistipes sp.]